MRNPIFIFLIECISIACNNRISIESTKINLNISSARGDIVYLIKTPYFDEEAKKIDSAFVENAGAKIIFYVPREKDRLYMIKMKNSSKRFYFIPDTSNIILKANNINGDYEIYGSNASKSLKDFFDMQNKTATYLVKQQKIRDSLIKSSAPFMLIDSITRALNASSVSFNQTYLNYADTVNSPAGFMRVYNNIDFGNNYPKLKSFILKASLRFSQYQSVQTLKKNVLEMMDIFENEYNIGDTLPSISLPDKFGYDFSTASLKGKYYLIDFWSSWCPQCMAYNKQKKAAKETLQGEKFEIVSVAIDAEKAQWMRIVENENFNWPQLIDEKMWQGTAVRTLKFDSIPFNFLVNPEGRIIDKAIKPDSLLLVLQRLVK